MSNYGDLIHEAIHAVLYDHLWAPVTTEHRSGGETGFVRVTDADPGSAVKPTGLLIDQASASFETDSRHGLSLKTDRKEWIWDAVLKFQGHVSVEEVEISLENPIIVSRAVSALPRQITIQLLDATYQSPARQQSTSGSKILFRFSVTLSPL